MCMFRLLLSFAVLLSSIVAHGQVQILESFLKNEADWYTTTKADAANVTELRSPDTGITYVSEQAYRESTNGFLMLLGRSVSPKGYIQFTLDEPCSNIKLYSRSAASSNQAVNVSIGDSLIVSNAKIPNESGGVLSIDIPECYQQGGLEFKIQASTNYNVQITEIVYNFSYSGSKNEPKASFPASRYVAKVGEDFVSPALTTDSDGLVSFSSSNIKVATVDNETGKVSIVGAGETVITANIAETSEFEPGEASYILVVLDSGLVLYPPITYDFCSEDLLPYEVVDVNCDGNTWFLSPGNGMVCDSPSSGQNQDILLTAPVYLSAEMHELVITVGSGEAGSSFIVGLVNEDLEIYMVSEYYIDYSEPTEYTCSFVFEGEGNYRIGIMCTSTDSQSPMTVYKIAMDESHEEDPPVVPGQSVRNTLPAEELGILQKFKDEVLPPYYSWDFDSKELEGVKIVNGHVKSIDLPSCNYNDNCHFPVYLLQLKYLTSLSLQYNYFVGDVFAAIGSDAFADFAEDVKANSNLQVLNISNNNISGNAGALVDLLPNLTNLDIRHNEFSEINPVFPETLDAMCYYQTIRVDHTMEVPNYFNLNDLPEMAKYLIESKWYGEFDYHDLMMSVNADNSYLDLRPDEDLNLTLSNGQWWSKSNSEVTLYDNVAWSFSLIMKLSYIPGDTNFDGNVDVADVPIVCAMIMGRETPIINLGAANLVKESEYDRIINALDLVKLINLILSEPLKDSGLRRSRPVDMARVGLSIVDGAVTLTSEGNVSAIDFTLQGAGEFTAEKHSGIAVASRRNSDGSLRVIAYSTDGSALPEGDIVIARTDATSTGKCIAASPEGKLLEVAVSMSGIEDEIGLSGLRVTSQPGALIVDSEKDVRVYTTSGTEVYSGMADNVRINLQSGVYVIVSGEKVVKCIVK